MAVKLRLIVCDFCRVAMVVLLVFLAGCSNRVSQNIHLRYGNPSQANSDFNNYLLEKPGYALAYSCQAGITNWVGWQLDRSWLGTVERSDNFRPDTDLPPDCYAVRPNDYRGSGYDRGHLIPSGDRTRRLEDNSDTFLMTNIIPQSPANNREVWRELEEYCRDLVFQGNELYIVAGGSGIAKKIAQSKVSVPKFTWKIVLVLEQPNAEITADNSYTIAVWMPNSEQVKNTNWRDYVSSVDEIEKKTGYNFFAEISKPVQKRIEKSIYSYASPI